MMLSVGVWVYKIFLRFATGRNFDLIFMKLGTVVDGIVE